LARNLSKIIANFGYYGECVERRTAAAHRVRVRLKINSLSRDGLSRATRDIGHQTRSAIEPHVGLAVRNRQTLTMCLMVRGCVALANSDVTGIMDHRESIQEGNSALG
jgi:hypothetical protein